MSKSAPLPQDNVDSYVRDRVEQYQSWYDGKSTKMKKLYLRGRIAAAVGAVIVPVLTGLPSFSVSIAGLTFEIASIVIAAVSLMVALLIALEGVLHHREQWVNYRSTEQYLSTQKSLFVHRIGDYSDIDDQAAFKLFVSRVETAIAEENAVTLNVLSRTEAETTATAKVAAPGVES